MLPSMAERALDRPIGPERTPEQDPGFAFRMITDIGVKALSAAGALACALPVQGGSKFFARFASGLDNCFSRLLD